MSYLYRHIRLDKNEPFYIGVGTYGDKHERAYSKTKRNKIWKDIVAKSDYEVEIILDDLSREEALEKEIEFIKLYGRIDNKTGILSNLTGGGECSDVSDITKERIRKTLTGRKRPQEVIDKMSKAMIGKKHPHTKEWNAKISKAHMGKIPSKEHMEKLRSSNVGRKHSVDWIEKKTKHLSKPIAQYDLHGNFIKEYPSSKQASIETGIHKNSISAVFRGISKTSGGFIWKRITQN